MLNISLKSKRYSLVLLLLLTGFWLPPAISAGVNAAHPRIWLDAAAMSRLQANVQANTPEWQKLKSWCDDHIGNNMRDYYQGLDWQRYMLNYALAYRATGNQAYAKEAVIYLRALTYDAGGGYGSGRIGNGDGGASSITHDSGYGARSYGMSLPVGRDWLDGADDLTNTLIRDINTRMDEWITWVFTDKRAYSPHDPTDNYYAGYFSMVYNAAIALDGDPGYKSSWLSRAETMWHTEVLPLINGLFDGGEWQEGWNYGHWAVREYLQYPVALSTGTTLNNHWTETNWHRDLVKGQLHILHPSRSYVSDNGSWSGDTKGDPRTTTLRFLATFTPLDSTMKGIAAWGANHMIADTSDELWENFLYSSPDIVEVTPNISNMGGLSHAMKGHGLTRGDDWSNTQATYLDVIGGLEHNDQGEHNLGELKISSRGEILLVDADTWQWESEFANILTISGDQYNAPYQEADTPGASFAMTGVPRNFTYFLSDHLESAYDGDEGNEPSASAYKREIAFLPPDHIVVLDNIQPMTKSNRVTLQWHFSERPTVSGTQISGTRGGAKLFLEPFGANFNISVHDASSERSESIPPLDVHRVEITPNSGSTDLQLFSVFQAADRSASQMDPTAEVVSADGHMKGININASTGALIAMFTKGASPQSEVVYTLPYTSDTTRHLLLGMEPGFYDVLVDNTVVASNVETTDKLALYFETGAGNSFYIVKSGELQTLFSSDFE